MKKLFALMLVSLMALALFAGCSSETTEEPTIVKVGLGSVIDMSKSRSAGDNTAQAQVDTTIVAASFDEEGKVITAIIDVAQSRVPFNEDMEVSIDKAVPGKTKAELGSAYNMKAASGIGKEWDEQIVALQEWMVGKTVAEIKGMEIAEGRPAEEDLTSTVTIRVGAYIDALEKAYANAVEVQDYDKLGLGILIDLSKSRDAGDNNAQAQVDTTFTATAFDAEGKVLVTLIDVAQSRVAFDEEGQVTTDVTVPGKTKAELGSAYNMKAASGIGKEWDEQIVALEEWMVGKTVAEIKAMEIEEGRPAEEDLTSTVTIRVGAYIDAVAKAYASAK